MFTIVVPSFNNLQYLKLLIRSLKKNSNFKHEIIIHVNEGSDGTYDYVNNKDEFTISTSDNLRLLSISNAYNLFFR